jgi:Tol biopolymer transport system component
VAVLLLDAGQVANTAHGAAPGAGGTHELAPPAALVDRVAGLAAGSVPAALPQPPGTTSLVSVSAAGGFPSKASAFPAVSASGRYVAFASAASDLVAGSTSGATAIFLRDRTTGTTIELPLPDGVLVPAGGQATTPSISDDGSVVAFTYRAPPGVTATAVSVMVWDKASGTTQAISRPLSARLVDSSREPAVSGDGRYVAFTSDDITLTPNDANKAQDVFRYDRQSGRTELVSVALQRGSAPGGSWAPSISGDGNLVAFTSLGGSALVQQDTGSVAQVYVRDMTAGVTSLVSVAADGGAPDGSSGGASISGDGQFVAFTSQASNLVAGFTPAPNQPTEVFRRDLGAAATVLVSAQSDGSPNLTASALPGISRDGRMVAYVQLGSIVSVATSDRQATSVLLRDVVAGATALISVNLAGNPSVSYSLSPHVAGLGRYVVFASTGSDLVAGDGNEVTDVFIRDLPPIPTLTPPIIDFGGSALGEAPLTGAGVMTNAGWGPMTVQPATITGTNAGDFTVLADGCAGTTLYRSGACTVTLGFSPQRAGTRTAQLQVKSTAPGSPQTARLRGVGSRARIVLNPPIGQQGIVVVATGDGFPAGAAIRLAWSTGITPTLPTVTADANGRWQLQVLVFHNDVVGPRTLVATWVGGPSFPTLAVPMLVTVRSAAPPGFGVGPVDSPLKLLFRG